MPSFALANGDKNFCEINYKYYENRKTTAF